MSYLVVTGVHESLPAGFAVSGLYLVASLEIVLRDSTGSSGMALRLHSYPTDETREGYWAPPNLQYRLDKNYEAPQAPRELVRKFSGFVNAHRESICRDVTLFAESFGLRGAEVEMVPEAPLLEVKQSINQPTVKNAFYTVRFTLRNVNEGSEVNLVDREGRHGFVNLPLGAGERHLPLNSITIRNATANGEVLYLGKPLISSLQRTLEDSGKMATLLTTAIEVSAISATRHETGLVAVADIAGYGRVLTTNYVGIMGDSESERRKYQARVLSALERALTITGTTQVQTVGDGFVAAYPVSDDRLREKLIGVVENWTETVRILHDDVNGSLARACNPERLGSRLAINFGPYEWGRINGLASFSPAFNGPTVVDAARLEQGLNAYMSMEVSSGALQCDAHLMALAPDISSLAQDLGEDLGRLGWQSIGAGSLRAKEKSFADVEIYAWRRD